MLLWVCQPYDDISKFFRGHYLHRPIAFGM